MATDPVLVVGGGLVGLSCAWFLRDAGAEVTVLERGAPGGGASRGNAGAICPSMCEPLPAPGMIRDALASMGRADAALYVHPRYAPRMAGFLRRFAAAATEQGFERGLAAMTTLARGVTDAYDAMAEAGIGRHARHAGYLFVHGDEGSADRERRAVTRAASMGLCEEPGPILGAAALRDEEPLLGPAARSGFVLPAERWIDPSRFVDDLVEELRARDVVIREDAAVTSITVFDDGVEVRTADGHVDADHVVLAAGAWTPSLVAPLGVKIPVYPGKGYSFSVRPVTPARRALHLSDAHVMATPIADTLRVAGTMEFDGTMDRFHARRVEAIVRGAQPYLDIDLTTRTAEWVGPRPMTSDGLPYIGRVPSHPRVVVAAGHNMLGLTLAPVTGRVVAGLVTANDPGIDLAPFALSR